MSSGPGFDPVTALIEHHVVGSLLKQGRLGPFLGETPRWSADLSAGRLQIAGTDFAADLLGTDTEADGRFTWSWALDGLPDAASASARALRDAGARLNVPELTEPQHPVASFDARRAAIIGSGLARADAYFLASNDGIRYAFLLRHAALTGLSLPVAHLPDAWQSTTAAVPFDHRRAFEHFAEQPPAGIEVTREERGFKLDDGEVAVRLTLD